MFTFILTNLKLRRKVLEETSGSPLVQASVPIQHTHWVSVYYNRLAPLVLTLPVTHLMSSAALHCLFEGFYHVWFNYPSIQFIPVIPYIQFSEQVRQIIPSGNSLSYKSPYLTIWPLSLKTEYWKVVQLVYFLLLSPFSSHMTICFSPGLVTQTFSPKWQASLIASLIQSA